ncbi:AMMECR1 protein [Klebsormidium nitens]|uniref:AMMECR1 protein n=1 Tax=Klebsormidium nitens TaxID=105231 RepID=A0A1Y1HMH3_KLENI|nr:AMMECR1 protein [Klebsormidium nitens]|eukprot:GAQ77747.1 AMMECR1 protein [Klebsormidium nitens]
MVAANKEMAVYCFDTLVAYFNGAEAPPPEFEGGRFPLFVTWKKHSNGREPRLRGCIGTLEGRCILTGFKDYSLTSALRDERFPPIQAKELPYLQVTVSLLTDYEVVDHYLDWEVGKHGMILEFIDPHNYRRSATYLPEVAQHEGWTQIEAVESLVRKAGYLGPITDVLKSKFRVTRYQSSLYTLTYAGYVDYIKRTRSVASVSTSRSSARVAARRFA